MAGAAGYRVVLKEDRSYAVSGSNGAMRSDSPDGHGLWIGDTRFLSDYRLRVDGEEPAAAVASVEGGSVRWESRAAGLKVERERYVDLGLRERITITNLRPAAAKASVELTLGTDFADMLALRGFAPELAAPPHAAARNHVWRAVEPGRRPRHAAVPGRASGPPS